MKDSIQTNVLDLRDFVPFQMSVIASRVFQMIAADSGVQMPEWRIIMALPRHQPCSSNDLCKLTSMDAARVSRAQRRLEDLGLVEVQQDRIDRRRLVVQLSESGMREYERLLAVARDAENEMLDGLDPVDRENLKSTLISLYERR